MGNILCAKLFELTENPLEFNLQLELTENEFYL